LGSLQTYLDDARITSVVVDLKGFLGQFAVADNGDICNLAELNKIVNVICNTSFLITVLLSDTNDN